jgi:hypothetical protein
MVRWHRRSTAIQCAQPSEKHDGSEMIGSPSHAGTTALRDSIHPGTSFLLAQARSRYFCFPMAFVSRVWINSHRKPEPGTFVVRPTSYFTQQTATSWSLPVVEGQQYNLRADQRNPRTYTARYDRWFRVETRQHSRTACRS